MNPALLAVLDRHAETIAEILVLVRKVPKEDRLDVMAVTNDALIKSGLLDDYRRDAKVKP